MADSINLANTVKQIRTYLRKKKIIESDAKNGKFHRGPQVAQT